MCQFLMLCMYFQCYVSVSNAMYVSSDFVPSREYDLESDYEVLYLEIKTKSITLVWGRGLVIGPLCTDIDTNMEFLKKIANLHR